LLLTSDIAASGLGQVIAPRQLTLVRMSVSGFLYHLHHRKHSSSASWCSLATKRYCSITFCMFECWAMPTRSQERIIIL